MAPRSVLKGGGVMRLPIRETKVRERGGGGVTRRLLVGTGPGTYTCPHADASSVSSCTSLCMAREGESRLGSGADGADGYKCCVRRVIKVVPRRGPTMD